MESFRENSLIKSRNQNIFEKFKLNRNLQTISLKMMYYMSMVTCRRLDKLSQNLPGVQAQRISGKLSNRIFWSNLPDIFCSVQAPEVSVGTNFY